MTDFVDFQNRKTDLDAAWRYAKAFTNLSIDPIESFNAGFLAGSGLDKLPPPELLMKYIKRITNEVGR